MLLAWAGAFERSGYAVDELERATDWLATHAPPRWREDHLSALVARLRAQRAAEYEREPAGRPDEDPPGCGQCRGSGWVSVPSRRQMMRGPWRGATEGVYCTCELGDRVRRRGPLGDSIDRYEREVPDWREMLERHWSAVAELSGASSRAAELDRLYGSILGRLVPVVPAGC